MLLQCTLFQREQHLLGRKLTKLSARRLIHKMKKTMKTFYTSSYNKGHFLVVIPITGILGGVAIPKYFLSDHSQESNHYLMLHSLALLNPWRSLHTYFLSNSVVLLFIYFGNTTMIPS